MQSKYFQQLHLPAPKFKRYGSTITIDIIFQIEMMCCKSNLGISATKVAWTAFVQRKNRKTVCPQRQSGSGKKTVMAKKKHHTDIDID